MQKEAIKQLIESHFFETVPEFKENITKELGKILSFDYHADGSISMKVICDDKIHLIETNGFKVKEKDIVEDYAKILPIR